MGERVSTFQQPLHNIRLAVSLIIEGILEFVDEGKVRDREEGESWEELEVGDEFAHVGFFTIHFASER